MRFTKCLAVVAATAAALLAGAAAAAAQPGSGNGPTGRAQLIDASGRVVGVATLRQTPNAGVWIGLELRGVPPGTHGFHIHETGQCQPPTFESAGSHYNPRNRAHGFFAAEGPHAGDMLNVHVPESGEIQIERLAPGVSLNAGAETTLFDANGSALVLHAGEDDYRSQPSGDSGTPIACGVITR